MTTLHEQLTARAIAYTSLRVGTQRLRCPECPTDKRNPALSLTILEDGGAVWLCHRCGFKGGCTDGTRHDWIKSYRRNERRTPSITPAEHGASELAAIEQARAVWRDARPADMAHPYIARKQITPTNWRQIDDRVLVPLLRPGWGLCDVQYITPAGEKRYHKGISTRGTFYLAKWTVDGIAYLCEGSATAVAIAAETGAATIAAMSRTNLLPVAQAFRRRHPYRRIIVVADNDHHTAGNPGIFDAAATAVATGADLWWPQFAADSSGTDFLDAVLERRTDHA